ncbi:sensor histidine kinase [Xanthomonas theicola]|uniref:histidine kinase n=1 Tax=Xanthomonas theicola TaxID=56464 RepID=A0A2S6ZFT1_9XANT|nr:HAMP domain-containing sensor histidine kinase [Xanthomonas theicola]PPT91093.1 PAS domain-containing sensor histidine kinase [Xanthomonas theicola]QNH26724.1 HAMP domain-containing histidine kinase [Xanthomonas theicola]
MPTSPSLIDRIESIPRRELYFFALYRVLVAGLIVALVFGPLNALVGAPRFPQLATWLAGVYLAVALLLLMWGRNERHLTPIVLCGATVDIAAATLTAHALPAASAGSAMMLLFNVAAAAMLLRLRYGFGAALLAAAATLLEYLWTTLDGGENTRSLAELAMFATSYLAVAYICHQIGQRARSSQTLAERRGAEVANLYEINELIIRRMRTGVLVVDAQNRVTLANEAASVLLGDADGNSGRLDLLSAAPELVRRLRRWRNGWNQEEAPLQLSPDQPEVQPRFARLLMEDDLTLVFLDDASVVSRRAESLTLSALGRFSASLAHEIRNPLAAISYASQLLEESPAIGDADRRLLQIIHLQCQRTNGIVESVLGLARRERSHPENLDLGAFVRRFVLEYRQTLSSETDSLEAILAPQPVQALVDPKHLHQILGALVHNALKYGRVMEEPARVRLRVAVQERNAIVDVMDRGPGIPEAVAAQLFRPFFTTSEHGTGLGLYIARELCRANQARLEYVPVPAGGACFRVVLPGPRAMRSG